MRVVYFWALPWPEARKAAEDCGAEITWTGDSDCRYWRELSARWDGSDDLVTVEHDVVVTPEALAALAACPAQWCTFAYPVPFTPRPLDCGLGLAFFSAHLQTVVTAAEILSTDAKITCPDCGGLAWNNIDGPVMQAMARHGLSYPHVHAPPVRHLTAERAAGIQPP